jgi:CubicO group peptidase (beta-lactamase class C family)
MTDPSRRKFIRQSSLAVACALSSPAMLTTKAQPDAVKFKTDVADKKLIAELEQSIPQMMQEFSVPGLSIALIKGAKIVFSKGFGVRSVETTEPVNTETVFEAASLSKPVFAYAALKLCDKGLLKLDEPLSNYLPAPYIADEPRIKLVTMRHVLTHTPGFPNWRRNATLNFINNPGEKFSYSGEGFVYLQTVVEQITRQPLQAFLKQEIFEPFAMPASSFIWRESYASITAFGHDPQGKSSEKMKPARANAAASMHTTATEYAKFIVEITRQHSKNKSHVSEKVATEMLKPQVKVNDSLAWGLGWGIQRPKSEESYFHWGNNNNRFKNFVVFSGNRKIALVVFTNSGNGLKLCKKLVPQAIGGDHPAFSWSMVN